MHRVHAWGESTHLAPKPDNKTALVSLQNRGGRAAIAARLCWVGAKVGDDLVTSLGGGKVGHSPVTIGHVPPPLSVSSPKFAA